MSDEMEAGVALKQPLKVSLAEESKEDQQNFIEAVDDAHIKTDITISNTGQQLMDELHDTSTCNPDLIFMDHHLTMDNGHDVLEEIKADEDLKNIPTIIYAESTAQSDIDAAYHSGASLYVPKPVFFRNLVRIIRRILTMQWTAFLLKPLRKNFLLHEVTLNTPPTAKTASQKLEDLKNKEPDNIADYRNLF